MSEIIDSQESGKLISIVMPKREEMIQNLEERGLLRGGSNYRRFYITFIESIANCQVDGNGLCLAWELASDAGILEVFP